MTNLTDTTTIHAAYDRATGNHAFASRVKASDEVVILAAKPDGGYVTHSVDDFGNAFSGHYFDVDQMDAAVADYNAR